MFTFYHKWPEDNLLSHGEQTKTKIKQEDKICNVWRFSAGKHTGLFP
jgi:hypothetical protein